MVSLPACVWLVSTLAAAGNVPSVVVLPLRAEAGVEKGSARILSEKLLDSVRHTRAFHRVVGLGDVEAALEVEQKRQLMDCASDSCAAELAGALGVELIMVTSLGRVGTAYVMTSRLLEARTAAVRASASRQVVGESEQVALDVMDALVLALVTDAHLLQPSEPAAAAAPGKTAPDAGGGGIWRLALRVVGGGAMALGGLGAVLAFGAWGSALALQLLIRAVYVPIHEIPGMEDPGTRAVAWSAVTFAAVMLGGALLVFSVVAVAAGVAALVVPAVL